MRRSSDRSPVVRSCSDLPGRRAPIPRRFRLPFPRWGSLAALGILAWVLGHLAENSRRGPSTTDGGLLGVHPARVGSVAFDSAGRWLASAGGDGSVYLWDLTRRELSMAFRRAPGQETTFAYSLAFSPDGSTVAAANCDGSVTMWDVASGSLQHTFSDECRAIGCLTFSRDGQLLAMGTHDHGIELWDVKTMRRLTVLRGGGQHATSVCFSPDGRAVASACADGTASLWDVSSSNYIWGLNPTGNHMPSLVSLAFSPDGQTLATASPTSGLALWSAKTGRRLDTPALFETAATALAFSPAGTTLARGTTGGMIEIWDAVGGRRLSAWPGHPGRVVSLAYSADGRTLASGGDEGAVRVWNVPQPDDPADRHPPAEQPGGRDPKSDERLRSAIPNLHRRAPPPGGTTWGVLFDKYAVRGIPHAVLLDQNGTVAATGDLSTILTKAAQLAGRPF